MKNKLIQEVNRIKRLANIKEDTSDADVILKISNFLKNATEEEKKDERFEKLKNFFKDFMQDYDEKVDDDKSIQLSNITEKGKELLNNPEFDSKLSEISNQVGVSKDAIIKLMNHESKLNPSITNSNGCVGLIQFCPDKSKGTTKTINGVSYDLSRMKTDLDYQMDAIKTFWLIGKDKDKIKDDTDLFIYNFFPIAAGKNNDFVLKTNSLSAQEIAHDNPIYNSVLGRDRDTPLTVGDLKDYYRKTGMV